MKRRILILLFSAVIINCYGQKTKYNSENTNALSLVGDGNLSMVSFNGSSSEDSYLIIRSTLGVGGYSETITTTHGSYVICQSIGQSSVIGTYKRNNYSLIQGFQQPINSSKVFQLPIEETLFANLYPNPFNNYIIISFKDRINEEILVHLTDIMGKIIFLKKFPASQLITLHLDHLNSGLYILKVSINTKQYRANIIKQYR